MITLSKSEIDATLPKLKVGIEKYLEVQTLYNASTNLSTDKGFQKKFNGFYRLRQRSEEWYSTFYNLFEFAKHNNSSFYQLLTQFKDTKDSVEASFISKMCATIDPTLPIIDKLVFSNLGLKLPYTNSKKRLEKITSQYILLKLDIRDFVETDNGKYLVQQFENEYTNTNINPVKMVDFVLWKLERK